MVLKDCHPACSRRESHLSALCLLEFGRDRLRSNKNHKSIPKLHGLHPDSILGSGRYLLCDENFGYHGGSFLVFSILLEHCPTFKQLEGPEVGESRLLKDLKGARAAYYSLVLGALATYLEPRLAECIVGTT